jgi:hypothetical protein
LRSFLSLDDLLRPVSLVKGLDSHPVVDRGADILVPDFGGIESIIDHLGGLEGVHVHILVEVDIVVHLLLVEGVWGDLLSLVGGVPVVLSLDHAGNIWVVHVPGGLVWHLHLLLLSIGHQHGLEMVVELLEEGLAVDSVVVAHGGHVVEETVLLTIIVVLLGVGVVGVVWVVVVISHPVSVGVGVHAGALVLEEGDNGVDVSVEEGWLDKVLAEGGDLPELLEVDGSNIPLEHWVFPVLTEDGEVHVFTEEGVRHDLIQLVDGGGVIFEVPDGLVVVVVVDHVVFIVMDHGVSWTIEFEHGLGVLVQLQDVQGLTGHGGHQKCGDNESFHVDWNIFQREEFVYREDCN